MKSRRPTLIKVSISYLHWFENLKAFIYSRLTGSYIISLTSSLKNQDIQYAHFCVLYYTLVIFVYLYKTVKTQIPIAIEFSIEIKQWLFTMITFWQHIQCTVEICTQYPYLLGTYLLLLTLRTTETQCSIEP